MLQLKLFGVPAIERDGVLLTGRATHRHRLALLALLALAPGRRVSRDKLIAFLWPDSDDDKGRNLLKVATYVVRSELGDDALLTSGDELRLSTDLVQVDALEFEAAVESGDHVRANALYRGPLLDGFFLSDAPEFEHWVDRERDRFTALHRKTLEALADGAAAAGDLAGSAELWKTCAIQNPYDSRIALRYMQALEASGNRAGAIQHAAIHARLLQEELGVASAPEVAAFAERLRSEPPAETPVRAVTVQYIEPGPPAELLSPPSAPLRKQPRKIWPVALATLFVLAFGFAFSIWPRGADPQQSIVVLPFANLSADPDNEYFSDGLTEEIITRLSAVPGLKVISRTSAMHYKGTKLSLPQIAAQLKVDHILEGSVRQEGGRVRISAQLIDARVDGHLWADNYEHKLEDSFRVQEDIAHQVVRELEVKLASRARRQLDHRGTRDAAAYELYQRGRYAWNTRTRDAHTRAIDYFNQAIARDSAFADAYAGLAMAYLTGYQLNLLEMPEPEVYDRLKWAAERALALNDESADAHAVFALVLKWQRNWPGAEREYRRALELNPGNASARSWLSLLLRGMDRNEEATREARLATEYDPFAVVPAHNYGYQCYHARDYECAVRVLNKALEITPYPGVYRSLGLTYAQIGKHDLALANAQRAVDLAPERPDFLADLAYVQARAGNLEEARATLNRAKLQPREGFSIARAYVALNEPDSAFAWFQQSNWKWSHRASRNDPALDPLRADPRFAQMVARVDRELGMK